MSGFPVLNIHGSICRSFHHREVLNINREFRDLKYRASKVVAQKKAEADKGRLNAAITKDRSRSGRKQAWQDSQDGSRPATGMDAASDAGERAASGAKSRAMSSASATGGERAKTAQSRGGAS